MSSIESVQQQRESNKSNNENNSGGGVKAERPMGRKVAKTEYIKQKYYEGKLKISKEALMLQKKRAYEIQRHKDIALFISSGYLSPEAQEVFRISRKKVLEKLKKEEAEEEEHAKRQRKKVLDANFFPISPEIVPENSSCSSRS